MAFPASSDTSALRSVEIEAQKRDHIRITAAADISQGDMVIVGAFCGIADEDIASGEEGTIHAEEGILCCVNDLVDAENTFDTEGADVFYKSSTKEFSDTSTAGYYHVGYVSRVKDSEGVVAFEKTRYATLIA